MSCFSPDQMFQKATRSARRLAALAIVGAVLTSAGCHRKVTPPDLSRFLGVWSPVSANLRLICSTGQSRTIPVTAPIHLVPGTSSDLLDDDPVCPVAYNVAGNVATALPGQICQHPKVVTKLNLLADTFTTLDGSIGKHDAAGKEDGFIDIKQGWPVNCTFVNLGTYTRAAR